MGQSLVLFSSVSLTSVLLLQGKEEEEGEGEVTEERPAVHITVSFLDLFSRELFFFQCGNYVVICSRAACWRILKQCAASLSCPLEKNQSQTPVFAQSDMH